MNYCNTPPNQPGPLAVAMVLGQRDYIDHATSDLLLVTGTAHLLSVSGMHLAILVILANFLAMLLRLPVRTKIICILLFCLFYTFLTGARPPVIRAAVLVGVLLVSVWLRRMNQPINTLSVAALILSSDQSWQCIERRCPTLVSGSNNTGTCVRTKSAFKPACAANDNQNKILDELINTGRNRLVVLAEQLARTTLATVVVQLLCHQHLHAISLASISRCFTDQCARESVVGTMPDGGFGVRCISHRNGYVP